jgi:hypothetical protein
MNIHKTYEGDIIFRKLVKASQGVSWNDNEYATFSYNTKEQSLKVLLCGNTTIQDIGDLAHALRDFYLEILQDTEGTQ